MGCVSSNNKEKLSPDELQSILDIAPQEWTQAQVIKWLQLTHDGDLKDLVEPFRAQKISGVTFVKLTESVLKNELEVKQFGLRDGFISARNKLLKSKTENQTSENPTSDNNNPICINTSKTPHNNQPNKPIPHTQSQSPNININTHNPNNRDTAIANNQAAECVQKTTSMHDNNMIEQQHTMSYQISHQPTPSNNHLITKPNTNIRHNQSFDNGVGVTPDPFAPPQAITNMHIMNSMNGMNATLPMGNDGYEKIPDSFSPNNPMSQMTSPFNGMPTTAFQDDTMAGGDDNYAQIDFADLNHSDIPPQSLRNGNGNGMNGYPPVNIMNGTTSVSGTGGGMNAQNAHKLYGMSTYQISSQVPYGGGMGSMPNMNQVNQMNNNNSANQSNGGQSSIHNHTQTGSNYDELPLEFIHNIPNPSPNEMNNISNGDVNAAMSGYQEIDFGDHDDNISSVPSNVPSNPESHRGPKIAIGSCVKVFDRTSNKWVEAEVEKVDNIQHNVYVKFLAPPHSRIFVSLRDIRQLSPPNNHKKEVNEAVGLQVSPSGDHEHPPIMSVEEKQIHEFARDLWKTLHKIDVKTIADANNEPIRGFSGKELVRHVKKHLKQHVAQMNDKDIHLRCNDLVKYQYIRLIASVNNDNSSNKTNDTVFSDSEKYLYQFENEKHREFIKDDQPDRRAWTRGTKVEIYSATLGGWQQGTVVEVNNDTLTITYGPPTQQMRKTLDRYQDDLVKSTQQFIENRRAWKKDNEIEVYSHGQHIWCQGRIEEVLSAKENQPVDIFRVFYTNNDDKDFSKYVDRWSPDLREVQQLSPKLAKYKKGTKVKVWSNSKQTWIAGVVIDVVPTYEVVNVRYGDHEKLVPVSSDDIKLLTDED